MAEKGETAEAVWAVRLWDRVYYRLYFGKKPRQLHGGWPVNRRYENVFTKDFKARFARPWPTCDGPAVEAVKVKVVRG